MACTVLVMLPWMLFMEVPKIVKSNMFFLKEIICTHWYVYKNPCNNFHQVNLLIFFLPVLFSD